jgi:hypothetical protein
MIGLTLFRGKAEASELTLLVPFLLVALGIAWVVSVKLSPSALSQVTQTLSDAAAPVWANWPIALLLVASVRSDDGLPFSGLSR